MGFPLDAAHNIQPGCKSYMQVFQAHTHIDAHAHTRTQEGEHGVHNIPLGTKFKANSYSDKDLP